MRQVFTILLSALSILVSAQTVQKGVVLEYNEKAQKTPLENVELNISAANSTVSDKNGNYSLNFLTLKAGDRVPFRNNGREIKKEGYEIFNKEALEQWNLNPNAPFSIVMCRSDKFKATCDNYYSKASANYKKQREKETAAINKLKEEGKLKDEEYSKQLAEIQDSYDRQLDNLENYVDRFARIDLSELKEDELEIIELVEQGLFDEAIAKYDDLKIEEKLAISLNNRDAKLDAAKSLTKSAGEDQEDINSLYESLYRKVYALQLAGGSENQHKAAGILRYAADRDTVNTDIQLKTGNFISEYIGDNDMAVYYFNNALKSCNGDDENNLTKVFTIYNCLGVHYKNQEKAITALMYFQKAREIVDMIAKNNITQESIIVLNNISGVLSNLTKYDRALEYNNAAFEYAMSIYGENNATIADIYDNAALIHAGKGDYEEALDYIEKALSIKREVDGENCPGIVTSIWNKAIVNEKMGDLKMAIEHYKMAINFADNIFCANIPKRYKIYKEFMKLEELFDRYPKTEELLPYYDKYVQILKTIFGENTVEIATYYSKMANIYLNNKNHQKALEYFDKWYAIHKNNDPEKIFENIYYSDLSKLYLSKGEYEISNDYLIKIIETNESIHGHYHVNTMLSYLELGSNYSTQERYEEAIDMYSRALNIQMNLSGPQSTETASMHMVLGYTYVSNNDNEKALDSFNKALAIYESNKDNPFMNMTCYYLSQTINRLNGLIKKD